MPEGEGLVSGKFTFCLGCYLRTVDHLKTQSQSWKLSNNVEPLLPSLLCDLNNENFRKAPSHSSSDPGLEAAFGRAYELSKLLILAD